MTVKVVMRSGFVLRLVYLYDDDERFDQLIIEIAIVVYTQKEAEARGKREKWDSGMVASAAGSHALEYLHYYHCAFADIYDDEGELPCLIEQATMKIRISHAYALKLVRVFVVMHECARVLANIVAKTMTVVVVVVVDTGVVLVGHGVGGKQRLEVL